VGQHREWGTRGERAGQSLETGETKLVDRYDDNHLIAPTAEAISWESEAELLAFNHLGSRCLFAGDVQRCRLG